MCVVTDTLKQPKDFILPIETRETTTHEALSMTNFKIK